MKATKIMQEIEQLEEKEAPRAPRDQVEWAKDRVFVRGHAAVTVLRLPLRRPKFRIIPGCKPFEDNDKVYNGFTMSFQGTGKLTVETNLNVEDLSAVVFEAYEYCATEAQISEDHRIDRRISFEQKQLNKGKQTAPPGLKKLGKLDTAIRRPS